MNENYCNNCGKQGHLFHQCKMPITSIGVIVFRYNKAKLDESKTNKDNLNNCLEYLMIRRKDTLGYVDFLRGKYSVYNKDYIINMMKQMTDREKNNLRTKRFDELWKDIWGNEEISNQYKVEEIVSREKFNLLNEGIYNKNTFYNLSSIIDESNCHHTWTEPEWGFPKGRRNYQEKDYECALREFKEETGLDVKKLHILKNLLPYEELFTGSNYKSYKHKYFVSFISFEDTLNIENYERSEVSKMEWKTYSGCCDNIRSYNLEKKKLILNIHTSLISYKLLG